MTPISLHTYYTVTRLGWEKTAGGGAMAFARRREKQLEELWPARAATTCI